MAQTKRKRRTKHRGNAAGMVESRGRTSKPVAGAPAKNGKAPAGGRGPRGIAPLKPPTLRGAALKALFGVVILFVFFRFLSKNNTTGQALAFCAVAFVMYTPVMYWTDKFIYNRKLRQQKR
ncbi:MAG: hypothetical protein QOI80_598 [Solirubrobacteraceae bacterium]|jgi:hypothetical protein|nr:hypothetical protein [Solirubrobacteraceae bacterium]